MCNYIIINVRKYVNKILTSIPGCSWGMGKFRIV